MRIQPLDVHEQGDLITSLHETYVTAYAVDDQGPPISSARFGHTMRVGRPGRRNEAWVVVEDGVVVGGYALSLPLLDNVHTASLFPLAVRPDRQGRGLGSALFEHAVGRVRAEGRTLLVVETAATGSGARFALAHRMTESLREARRTLDLRKADWEALERMRPHADGYSLERWVGPTPPELLPDLAALMNGMNDAPRDDDFEDENYTVERLRELEESMVAVGETGYTVVARRDSDGAPAGFTRIVVGGDGSDGWGHQVDTTVLKEHRGHRLGLLLKLANLFWLREREPLVERIITWNATSNSHMLAINEAMGFELFDEWTLWRLDVQAWKTPHPAG
ncbi:GNAT family N-acetyltransferase [Nonomuraea sp. NPDC046802]|uniref:GNAT family N-acetyltransferase n=1 Tax=Nonomuraea sp. NPDC046802 TaxID=3154919 RepID=UPI0033F0DDE7